METDVFVELGLTPYEVKVWKSLVFSGSVKASDVAENSEVPRTRVYDVLRSLERKGWIFTNNEEPKKFGAVSPKMVLGNKLEEKVSELKKVGEKRIEKLGEQHSATYKEFEEIPPASMPLFDEDAVIKDMQDLIDKAHDRIYFAVFTNEFLNRVFPKLRIPRNLKVWVLKRRRGAELSEEVASRATRVTPAVDFWGMRGGYFVVDGEHTTIIWTEPRVMGYKLIHYRDRLRLAKEFEHGMETGVVV